MRRLSNWSIAGIIAGVLLLIVGGLALETNAVANRAWAAAEERARALIAEARARPKARPVLREPAEPGNAWADYDLALAAVAGLKPHSTAIDQYLRRLSGADPDAVAKVIEENLAILDHLRRGARRVEGSYPYDWELGSRSPEPKPNALHPLSAFARARARMLWEGGRPGEAADLLLSFMQCASDLRRNSAIIPDVAGMSLLCDALRELRAVLANGRCTAEEAGEIARQLEFLDTGWPDCTATSSNVALQCTVDLLAEVPGTTNIGEATAADWFRYWFSYRLMAADAAAKLARNAVQVNELAPLAWSDCVERRRELRDEAALWRNPLAPHWIQGSVFWNREKLTQLRLVRVEAHYRATGRVLDLKDPFGDRLLLELKNGRYRVWSVGVDGLDHRGKGAWEVSQHGFDMVVELPK